MPRKRYTKYHVGVAVIDGKENLSAAMAKLAKYENLEQDEPHMQEMADELAEYVCTQICNCKKGGEECKNCRLGALIERMERAYNVINLYNESELERLINANCVLEKENMLLKQNIATLIRTGACGNLDEQLKNFIEETMGETRMSRAWAFGALNFALYVGLVSPAASSYMSKKYFGIGGEKDGKEQSDETDICAEADHSGSRI